METILFNNSEENPLGIVVPETEKKVSIETAYHVLLFNDDIHTFDEVINQLIKAIKCTFEKARDIAFEVHTKGKALVYSGSLTECLKISSILEEIALHTQITT